MDRDLWSLALVYGASALAYAACVVPLVLLQKDLRRAGVRPNAHAMTFALKVLLFLVPADVIILVVALSLDMGEATVTLATAIAALVVVTLAYRAKHRQLLSSVPPSS